MSVATDPIRNRSELKALANYFLKRGELRNYTLVVLGAHTALRISDLLRLRWEDVYDFERGRLRDHLSVTERKTGKHRRIALNREALKALSLYFAQHRGAYLFSNHRKKEKPISRVQAWRILHTAAAALGLTGHIGCHSLRKTWGYNAWSRARIRPEVIMMVYNHSSFEITKRYLGITQDTLDAAYLRMQLF
ncbi:MAG: tyrosine-type recombinase/integrase [Oscillospiraceae bacterium]|nr:tyrosine-type recombinase/integrase [Oscillospiraceae bacterium]